MRTLKIPLQKTPHFSLSAHTITWKQEKTLLAKKFSAVDLEAFLVLYEIAQKKPKKAVSDLESLKDKHPHLSEILNLLTFTYLRLKKIKKAEKLIEENYRINPENILAKINYADQCIRKNKLNEIPQIFNQTYDLQRLYPQKKTFHISEFRGFMVVMGFYHLKIKKREKAICYHYLAHKVDPKHPSTKLLERKIYRKSWFQKFFNFSSRTLKFDKG